MMRALIASLLLALALPGSAANTRGDAELGMSAGGVIDVTTFDVTAGDSIVCLIVGGTTDIDITSVVWDAAGDNQAFTQVGVDQENNIHTQWMYVLGGVTSTKSGTIRATQLAGFSGGMHCSAWSGTDTASPVGQVCQPAETTSATPTCTLTGAAANSSIFAIVSNNNSFGAGGYTAGTNFTLIPGGTSAGSDQYPLINSYSAAEYWADTGTAGNKTVAFSSASSPWILSAFEMKTAGGGAPSGALLLRRRRN